MKNWLKRGILHMILACELMFTADVLLRTSHKVFTLPRFYLCLLILWLVLMLTVRISPKKLAVVAVAVPLCVMLCVAGAFGVWKTTGETLDYISVDEGKAALYADQKVMVIVPHEDDDINIAGGLLEQYVTYGSEVYVVFVTNGDYYNMAETRIAEAIEACAFVGIEEDHVIFLGYGDSWSADGPHIYNAAPGEVVTSYAGYTKTYGTAAHPAYQEGTPYTSDHLLADMKSVVLKYRPDTILCSDYDFHVDHKAVTMVFEKAMGQILRETPDYTPTVLKAYAYNTAWYAAPDFYEKNILSTENVFESPYNQTPQVYRWEDRLRLPVAAESLSRSLVNSEAYAHMAIYRSQDAVMMASSVINGDKVFWERRTDSLLPKAQLETTSGRADLLNDFMLIHSDDLQDGNRLPYDGTWIPAASDGEREIAVTFEQPTDVYEVVLYDNPSEGDNVLNATIVFDNGTTVETGPLVKTGSATSVVVEQQNVRSFTVLLTETEGTKAGLTELEAFASPDRKPFSYIKLMDSDGHFVYDYLVDSSGTEVLQLYTYGTEPLTAESYTVAVSNDACTAAFAEGGTILVNCPRGETCTLTVTSRTNPAVSDSVYLQNPTLWQRAAIAIAQGAESIAYNGYWDDVFRNTVFYRTPAIAKAVLLG